MGDGLRSDCGRAVAAVRKGRVAEDGSPERAVSEVGVRSSEPSLCWVFRSETGNRVLRSPFLTFLCTSRRLSARIDSSSHKHVVPFRFQFLGHPVRIFAVAERPNLYLV